MSNTTTTAFMLIQARSCLTNAVRPLSSKPRELDWANRIFRASDLLHKIYNEIMEFEELEETMDKQINKLKKVTKTNNTKKRKSGKRS